MSAYKPRNTKISLSRETHSPSPAESVASHESLHDQGGVDGGIISRIKRMRKLMQSVRQKLAVERERLARERLEAEMLPPYQSAPNHLENLETLHGFHSAPTTRQNSGCVYYRCQPANSTQNYQQGTYYCDRNQYQQSKTVYVCNIGSENFKEKLKTVEKMCDEEFDKIQDSINSLRISKQYLSDRFSDNGISYTISNNWPEKLDEPRSHKHRNRCPRNKKIYRGDQRNKKIKSFYVQNDSCTLNQHRHHYCYHYKSLPPIYERYLNHKSHNTRTQKLAPERFQVSSDSSDAVYYSDIYHDPGED